MTKKDVRAFFLANGYKCSYSGNTKTFYIHGIAQIELDALSCWANCSFTLKAD